MRCGRQQGQLTVHPRPRRQQSRSCAEGLAPAGLQSWRCHRCCWLVQQVPQQHLHWGAGHPSLPLLLLVLVVQLPLAAVPPLVLPRWRQNPLRHRPLPELPRCAPLHRQPAPDCSQGLQSIVYNTLLDSWRQLLGHVHLLRRLALHTCTTGACQTRLDVPCSKAQVGAHATRQQLLCPVPS